MKRSVNIPNLKQDRKLVSALHASLNNYNEKKTSVDRRIQELINDIKILQDELHDLQPRSNYFAEKIKLVTQFIKTFTHNPTTTIKS